MAKSNYSNPDEDKENELHIKKKLVSSDIQPDSALKKAAKLFLSEDIEHVTDSIMDDFVKKRTTAFGLGMLQKAKEFIYESVNDFTRTILFGLGNSIGGSRYYKSDGGTYTSYNTNFTEGYTWVNGRYVKATPENTERRDRVHERPIKNYGEALEVCNALKGAIAKFGKVSVADYYMSVGLEKEVKSIDYEFVWRGKMLDDVKPRYTSKGYILNLPKPVAKED